MAQDWNLGAPPPETGVVRSSSNARAGAILAEGPHDRPDSNAPNLNLASEKDIAAVDFVGASLAHTIVSTRERLGSFESWQALHEATGIKANKIAELQRTFKLAPKG
jgi:DNA uptake protein ComE-like DNA-binding protein